MAITLSYERMIAVPGTGIKIGENDLERVGRSALKILDDLNGRIGDNRDGTTIMLGWQGAAANTLSDLDEIEERLNWLKEQADLIFVIGIGGSYLGAKALIEASEPSGKSKEQSPEIRFLGFSTDPRYIAAELDRARRHKVGCVVISKSGGTIEPALAFRLVRELIEEQHGSDASRYIKAVTGTNQSVLHNIAKQQGYDEFSIPDDIGGRYSIASAVGAVPCILAGIDVRAYLEGMISMKTIVDKPGLKENPAVLYATIRHLAHCQGAVAEYQVTNRHCLQSMIDWLIQLQAESEGHYHRGLHIVPALYPRDLHSIGQMIQQGPRNIIEIATVAGSQGHRLPLPSPSDDGLDTFVGAVASFDRLNELVVEAALDAHFLGGVPNLTISLDRLDPYHLGAYQYMMMKATAIRGYLLGHNPFVQPGVKHWKESLAALATGTSVKRVSPYQATFDFARSADGGK